MEATSATDERVGSPAVQDGAAPPAAVSGLADVRVAYREYVQLRQEASYWRRMHERATQRAQWVERRHQHELAKSGARVAEHQAEIASLRIEIDVLQAKVRDLRQRVFGAHTEQSRVVNPGVVEQAAPPARRPRGQQRGRRGHGRRLATQLPQRTETLDVAQPVCPGCGVPLGVMPGVESREVVEVEVRAYRRTIVRPRWRVQCRCACLPGIVSAPPAPQLIPRGKLGVSVWVQALLGKYLYGQPTHRLLQDWREQGLHVAQGTLTDGLKRLAPFFAPLAQAGLEQLRSHRHWHADETRWEVYVEREGKVGHRWYLWVFRAEDVVHFTLDPSRSASVPSAVLAGVDDGILSVDRYAAYGKFARTQGSIELAYCWAHQRRDFLKVANDHPALWAWAMAWAERISELYRLHDARRQQHRQGGAALAACDVVLRTAVQTIAELRDSQLGDATLALPARKALNNLVTYWDGLTVFLAHPWLDLDNNAAERALRTAVVARKNFYGSGSEWSATLTADMLSLLMTARHWKLHVRRWLHEYLQACADAGGRAPEDLAPFVPWRMSAQRLAALRRFEAPSGQWNTS